MGAKRRSFWVNRDLWSRVTSQGFIPCLVADRPVSEVAPGSLLQRARNDIAVLEAVAAPLDILIN